MKKIKNIIIVMLVIVNICILSYLVVADLTTEHTKIFYDTIKSETISSDTDGNPIVSYRFDRHDKVVTLKGEDAKTYIDYDIDTVNVVQVVYSESKLDSEGHLIFIYIVSWK